MRKLLKIKSKKEVLLVAAILAISTTLINLTGCSDSTENDIPDELDVTLSATPLALQFSAEGGEQSVSVQSNSTWEVIYDSDKWYHSSLQKVKGDADVTIVADENSAEKERDGAVVIEAEGADKITITISQEGKEKVVEPTLPDYIDPDQTDMRDITAIDLSKLMGLGWNLGNSLESINVNNGTYSGSETTWGNPVVTKQLIDSVKAAGFKTIRIPVAWSHNILDQQTFEIKAEWLERVEEVVNYVLENDMYAMINIHWDGGWMNNPTYAHQDQINTKLSAFWKQIAKHFRDHNDYLLFAGTNEVHVENVYSTPTAENYEVQNSFNQTFVEVVRATGGKNAYRHLIVQGFNTNISQTVDGLVIPNDNIENKLMVEVHFYDPWDYALKEDVPYKTQWGKDYAGGDVSDWGQEDWVDEAFGNVKTNFIDKGYPVILGEYGAILRSSLVGDVLNKHVASRNYYLNYVTKSAIDNKIIPCYWDNGHLGDNGFGLFDRSTGEQVHKDAIEAIISAQN